MMLVFLECLVPATGCSMNLVLASARMVSSPTGATRSMKVAIGSPPGSMLGRGPRRWPGDGQAGLGLRLGRTAGAGGEGRRMERDLRAP
jgi:hypothetical protein